MRRNRNPSLVWTLVALGGIGAVQAACFSAQEEQCLSEADCTSRGGSFANTTCDPATKTCVASTYAPACTKNTDCIAANGNTPAICRKSDQKCVVLQNADCPDLFAGENNSLVANDDAIVIGYMGAQNSSSVTLQWERASKLAQEDFVTSVPGIPSFDGTGANRPVVLLGCNEFAAPSVFAADPSPAVRAAQHLVNDVQVPIILGPLDSFDAAHVISQVALAAGTMMILPTSPTTPLEQLGPNPASPTPLVWRMPGTSETLSQAMAQSISGPLAQRAVDLGLKTATEPLRVLLIEEQSPDGLINTSELISDLVFDGLPASQHDSSTFAVVNDGNPQDNSVTPDPVVTVSENVLPVAFALKPHIIVHGGTAAAFSTYVIEELEKGWTAGTGGAPLPLYYTHSSGVQNGLSELLPALPGGDPSLPSRVFYESPATAALDAATMTTFLSRFNAENADDPITSISSSLAASFDGIYLAEYALTAIGNAPVSGVNAAKAAASKLSSGGQTVNADPSQIGATLSLLGGGSAVTLSGLSGTFNFDPTTGAPTRNWLLNCLVLIPAAGVVIPFPTGWVYNSTTSTSSGAITAPQCILH